MSSESPASILFSTDGYELAVKNEISIPEGTRALLIAGSDGSSARIILVDSSNRIITVGAGTAGTPTGGVLTVQGIDDGYPVNVLLKRATVSTLNNVAGSASSVTLLAENNSRINASIYNDSSSLLYVKLGSTASISSFTIRLLPYSYWEIPESYTGVVDGIWANANGYARVDELT